MNRLFYTPDQCGLSKVEAAKRSLAFINPDVVFEARAPSRALRDPFLWAPSCTPVAPLPPLLRPAPRASCPPRLDHPLS